MKHGRFFVLVGLAAAVALAVFAVGSAFGWWYTSSTLAGNSIGSGTATLASGGGTINLTNLQPQVDPATTDPDTAYGAVSYVWVQNTGTVPLMFYAYLADPTGDTGWLSQVHVRIWLEGALASPPGYWAIPSGWSADTFQVPGPWLVYDGPLSTIWNSSTAGKQYLGSVTPGGAATPIQPNQIGIYRIAVWLPSTADNGSEGQTAGFSLNFWGETLNQWNVAKSF